MTVALTRSEEEERLVASFACLIRTYRAARGLTQSQVAEAGGLSLRLVQRIEAGEYAPRLLNLSRLARGLGVTLGELLGAL